MLVEYPLSLTIEEAKTLAAESTAAGRVLMVGNTIIHESSFRYIEMHTPSMGCLVSAMSRVALYDKGLANTWYMDPSQTGSCFPAFHYHHIEYYRRILGEVTWVNSKDESRRDPTSSQFLTMAGGTLVMGHQTGATSVVQWYLSASGCSLVRDMQLNGIDYSLQITSVPDETSRASWHYRGRRGGGFFPNDWGVNKSCEDFLAAINGEINATTRLNSDIQTLRVGLAAAESSRIGQVVSNPCQLAESSLQEGPNQ